ncbi:gibberellin 3-beta-dioxygenase 2-like [Canna indica]|uniref:gibberellin 3beta-dioxygenase n=1 Tax=Canna indica TaxID=4628 RepID=A0AAQ3QG91_9LILI|nr:gibberellin 3-beta-dioxygenase 2-like [Canna indica]
MPSLSDHQFEFKTLPEVPETHAWTTLHDHPYTDDDSIPVIDLASPDDAAALIGRACREWGAFQITGHGIPFELLERVEAQTQRLFSLPAAQKQRAARGPGGITGYGMAVISSFFSKLFWSEGFTIVGSARDDARKLWPDADDADAEFCGAMEEFARLTKNLARRLMLWMLLSLGLSEEDIDRAGVLEGHDEVKPVLQLNHYPACPQPDRAMGLAEHTDSSFITILYQSSGVGGLQLLHGARWVAVPPIPGALVVNVGDLSHIISNGQFESVLHRAVVNRSRARISVAYFFGPQAHMTIAPMENLVSPNRGPVYRAVTWPEYLSLKKKLYNKTLASLRLPSCEEKWENKNEAKV